MRIIWRSCIVFIYNKKLICVFIPDCVIGHKTYLIQCTILCSEEVVFAYIPNRVWCIRIYCRYIQRIHNFSCKPRLRISSNSFWASSSHSFFLSIALRNAAMSSSRDFVLNVVISKILECYDAANIHILFVAEKYLSNILSATNVTQVAMRRLRHRQRHRHFSSIVRTVSLSSAAV